MKKLTLFILLLSAFLMSSGFMLIVKGGGVGSNGCAGGEDGQIGFPGPASSNKNINMADTLIYMEFTPVEDGNVNYIHIELRMASEGDINVGIWEKGVTTATLLSDSISQTGPSQGTLHFTLDSEVCLVTGTTYIIGGTMSVDVEWQWYADWESGYEIRSISMTAGNSLSNFTHGDSAQKYADYRFRGTANNNATSWDTTI